MNFYLQLQTFPAGLNICNLANLSAGMAVNLQQSRHVACYSALGYKNLQNELFVTFS